ncbi:unnamed protein product [Kluyveromyces dobzhanskii CBS 2104]|uniref:WGS project CCBQ000000000 data, contig 00058 n=1 Tax=Kluyveromyces dobzhanskii CBS 2104 TaxID=1427455 RepID=A0A0A8LCC8_9SACH|nr:unnamed protein product [Kluyveromyces dobzhanskii CBS 2104]
MKFAEHLRESVVPEWSDKYVNYKLGKKKIKQFQKLKKVQDVGSMDRTIVRQFIDDWVVRDQLRNCDEFYEWQLSKYRAKFNKLQRQIRLYVLEADKRSRFDAMNGSCSTSISRATDSYGSIFPNFSPVALTDTFRAKVAHRVKCWLVANNLYPSIPVAWKNKDPLLRRKDRTSVTRGQETFQSETSHLSLSQIRQQLSDAILDFYLYLQLLKNFRDLNVNGFRKIVKKFDKVLNQNQLKNFMPYAKKNSTMFNQYDEYLKLIKDNVEHADVFNANLFLGSDSDGEGLKKDPLTFWEQTAVKWYTMTLTSSSKDKKDNLERIKNLSLQYSVSEQTIHRTNASMFQMFLGSIQLGISVTLVILMTVILTGASDEVRIALLPIWSSFHYLTFMGLLYIVNCFVWFKVKINYRFIMFGEIHSRNAPVLFNNDFAMTHIPLQFFHATTFLCICSVLAFCSLILEDLEPWMIIWLGLAFILFFWKFKSIQLWPYWYETWPSRKYIITSFIRLVFSGFFSVQFGDFFLGDIICSLTYSMSQFATLGCVTFNDAKEDRCRYEQLMWIGILSCLPSYWRFVQCLRRYFDSYDWFPHLLNAFKYVLGILFNASLYWYKSWPQNPTFRTLLIVSGCVNSTLTSIWDLSLDWSLLQTKSKNYLLRDDLYLCGKKNWKTGKYGNMKSIYYFLMVFDVVIRFEWVFYMIKNNTDYVRHPLIALAMATLEIFRRFIWIILRVENEHVANVHLFKVAEDNWQLPFPTIDDNELRSEEAYSTVAENMDNIAILSAMKTDLESQSQPTDDAASSVHRRASVFEIIPWAHTTDFQRPIETASIDSAAISDSESEAESMV